MRSASGGLTAFLNANNVFTMADLFTFTLADATVLRWTTFGTPLDVGDYTFACDGPIVERGRTRVTNTLEVDTLDITLYADPTVLISGIPLVRAAMNGVFDGARVKLERVFMPTIGDTSLGTVVLFEGAVAGVTPSALQVGLTIKSELERLNVKLPHNLYMPMCSHALFDPGCGLNKADYTVTSAVIALPAPTKLSFKTGLTAADGYYDLGVVTFTSGTNAGARRAVKSFVSNVFTLALPLPFIPAAGDTISTYPGCKKDATTCKNKFNNANRFRGFPYVPRPETTW